MAAPTPSQTIGPFFHLTLGSPGPARMVGDDHPGATALSGRVVDGAGDGVSDALVELWDGEHFALSHRDRWRFLLRGGQAPHGRRRAAFRRLRFCARASGSAVTRCYFPDDAGNATDRVLATVAPERRATLIASSGSDGLGFDICLQGDRETVFFAL